MNNPQINVSDSLWIIAEAAVKLAEKSGNPVKLTEVYSSLTAADLACAGRFIISAIEKTTGTKITIINN